MFPSPGVLKQRGRFGLSAQTERSERPGKLRKDSFLAPQAVVQPEGRNDTIPRPAKRSLFISCKAPVLFASPRSSRVPAALATPTLLLAVVAPTRVRRDAGARRRKSEVRLPCPRHIGNPALLSDPAHCERFARLCVHHLPQATFLRVQGADRWSICRSRRCPPKGRRLRPRQLLAGNPLDADEARRQC